MSDMMNRAAQSVARDMAGQLERIIHRSLPMPDGVRLCHSAIVCDSRPEGDGFVLTATIEKVWFERDGWVCPNPAPIDPPADGPAS